MGQIAIEKGLGAATQTASSVRVAGIEKRYALISVTDKTNVSLFGELVFHGWTILSTGGTAQHLEDASVFVTRVEHYTGFPEMMDGRLKTLHPKVHGGLLGVTSNPQHAFAMGLYGIVPIDLLVVNLYDFGRKPSIENIDIGGPAMIRSAAKNFDRVTVVVDPKDYAPVLLGLTLHGETSIELRRALAKKAFGYIAAYDAAIEAWF